MMLGEHPICIGCEYKYQQSRYMVFAQNAAMLNLADREMTMAVGMPELSTQIQIPPAPIPPIHYNHQNVNVSGGTVGAINFGNIRDIQVSVQALAEGGEVGVADALANLTNAITEANEIAEAEKNALLEQIAFLSAQASTPPAERKPGMVKSVLSSIKDGALAIGAVGEAWGNIEPILHTHFGL